MRRVVLIVLAGLLSVPFAAKAADQGYFFVGAGVDLPGEELDAPVHFSDFGVRTDTKAGFLVNCGGGYQIAENLRLEGQVGYRSSKIDDIEVTYMNVVGIGVEGGSGDITSLSFMVNTWYDFYDRGRWLPYFGGGIGAAQVSLKDFSIGTHPSLPNPPITQRLLVDDEDWQFAYQAGAGLGYALSESFTVDLGYRYFASLKPKFTDAGANELKADYVHHSVQLAMTYKF
ncbi:MAG: outer membrane beta-barrel protein [Candidatus Zixiibacteriota bacterium]